jgi:DNA-binding Lrp family transcriptional regulator
MTRLDDTDRALISALRTDGRAQVSKLAAIAGVSRGTVENRLAKLQQSGVILGFTVRVKEDNALDAMRAVMAIEVQGKSTSAVIRSLRGIPELYSLHTTNGTWDLIAEIRTSSLQDFDRVLREVRSIDGVLNSETSLLLSSV